MLKNVSKITIAIQFSKESFKIYFLRAEQIFPEKNMFEQFEKMSNRKADQMKMKMALAIVKSPFSNFPLSYLLS